MKKTSQLVITVITTSLLSSMIASAENTDNKVRLFEADRKKTPPKHLLEKFDQDGNGTLDETERNQLKQTMSERRQAVKAKILKRFDSDKDGQLSPEEKKAAAPIIIDERKKIKAALLEQFDKDSDGKLSMDEREGAREWVKQNYPDAIALRARKGDRNKGPQGQDRRTKKNNLN